MKRPPRRRLFGFRRIVIGKKAAAGRNFLAETNNCGTIREASHRSHATHPEIDGPFTCITTGIKGVAPRREYGGARRTPRRSPPWILSSHRQQPSTGSTALARGAGGALSRELAFPSLSQGDQALAVLLINRGLLSAESARAAQVYCDEHKRDLRQSILELNLISPDVLNQLAFERLSALATTTATSSCTGDRPGGRGGASFAGPHPASPRRAQGASRKGSDGHALRAGQSDSGARLRLRVDRHPFRSAGKRPAGAFPDRRPASRHPVHRARDGDAGGQPDQDHLELEHRRAQAIAGRPDHHPASQPSARSSRGDLSHDLRREDRHPDSRGADRRHAALPTWACPRSKPRSSTS